MRSIITFDPSLLAKDVFIARSTTVSSVSALSGATVGRAGALETGIAGTEPAADRVEHVGALVGAGVAAGMDRCWTADTLYELSDEEDDDSESFEFPLLYLLRRFDDCR